MPIVRISSDMTHRHTRPRTESALPLIHTPSAVFMRAANTVPRIRGAVLMMLVLLLTACTIDNPLAPAPADVTGAPSGEPSTGGELPGPAGESRQLVLWLPAFFDPAADSTAGSILSGAFFQFEQNNPGLGLDVQIKSEFGQTGILNYLRSAQRVAPAILPDVVLIHSTQLWQIADLGLIAPLSPEEITLGEGQYAVALDAATYRNQLYGIPYTVNLLISVMPTTAAPGTTPMPGDEDQADDSTATPAAADMTQTPPPAGATPPLADGENSSATWDTLLAGGYAYIYPAGALEGSRLDSAVMHYRAAGGQLDDEGAALTDLDALETMFEFLILARRNNTTPEWVVEYADYESLWSDFVQGEAGNLALMPAQHLLPEGDTGRYHFLPVPTAGGELTTIGNTWAFAILTQDEQRRELAQELIAYLLAPSVHGAWSQAANRLPSRLPALEEWNRQNELTDFLAAQLPVAEAIPAGRVFSDFARRLHNIQAGLLLGELSLEEALIEIRAVE